MDDLLMILVVVAALVALYYIWQSTHSQSLSSAQGSQKTSRAQMVEDIKSTQTSRVSDAIEILDELNAISPNHRQYCELIGTSMKEGGVVAPYSQRAVAYYDVRCYKIEYKAGQEVETLVAHETSIDPFYFKDDSSDTPIYVDIKAFDDNVILVNSTNHIEGPESEFAKAVSSKISAASKGGNSSYAIVAGMREKLGNLLGNFRHALDHALLPGGVPATAELALAGTDGSAMGANLTFARMDDMMSRGKAVSSRGGRPAQRRPSGNITINLGGLGSFLGGGYGYGRTYGGGIPFGGYGGYRRGYSLGDAMLDIGLGALLGSLSSAGRMSTQTQTTTPQSTFRGYRLVENVVPLGSPVYCIGELYRHGTDVYMGSSTSSEYATSFFATKPEAEVLSQLGANK